MEKLFHISSSPHIKSPQTTNKIMIDVCISLLPALVMGTVIFGASALLVVGMCVASCVLSEAIFNIILKREQTIGDFSAAVTGLLLGLNLNASTPLWQAAVGSVFAIIIVKCVFGGLGKNIVNPAMTARVFMLLAFTSLAGNPSFPVDAVASATPLDPKAPAISLLDLFLGNHGGAIGETCAAALLLGGIYLVIKRVITPHIPLAFIGTVFLLSLAFYSGDLELALREILMGGLFLGAIFMATDYVTSPATGWGKVIFGIGAGAVTCLIRFWGNTPEGVSYAILLMNILCPYIEKWTRRRLFGGAKK